MTREKNFFDRRFLWALVLGLPLVILLLGRQAPTPEPAPTKVAEDGASAGALVPAISESTDVRRREVAIEHWATEGASVHFLRADEVPILDVRLVFNGGSARDGELPGLASLTSSLLSEGTRSSDAQAVATAFESVGADFSTSSHRDMAIVELRTLAAARFRGPAVEMLLEVLREPAFADEALAREKKRMLAALRRKQQSPGGILSRAWFPTLYGDHPYGIPPDGTEDSVPRLERTMVQDFYQRYYNRNNVRIILVGAITRADAEALASALATALPTGERAPALPEVTPEPARTRHIPFGSEQAHIQFGMPSVKRVDPALPALMVGNEILGGGGLTSVLSKRIRDERGLAYSVYSYFSPMQASGPFGVGLQTRADQADEAIALVRETLREFLEEGPSEEQVANARRHLAGSFPLQTASNASLTGYLGSMAFYDLPLDYLDTYVARIQAVTREDVLRAFRAHVDPEQLLLMRVGPAGESGNAP